MPMKFAVKPTWWHPPTTLLSNAETIILSSQDEIIFLNKLQSGLLRLFHFATPIKIFNLRPPPRKTFAEKNLYSWINKI